MPKNLLVICVALVLAGCAEYSSQNVPGKPDSREKTTGEPPDKVVAPIIIKFYQPLDCGASQLLLVDKSGKNLYLYNKPFRAELFLSAKGCSFEPDLTCSVQITKGHRLQAQLAAALAEFADTRADEKALQKIRAESDFMKLTEPEQVLFGVLLFAERLRAIE